MPPAMRDLNALLLEEVLHDISRTNTLPARWKECGDQHYRSAAERVLGTEVCLSHGGLHGDTSIAAPPADGKRQRSPKNMSV
jgi:hypothetical protein